MKEKKLYRMWSKISGMLMLAGIAFATVWVLHYISEFACEGHDAERFIREMLISAGLIIASVFADNIADWYGDKVQCAKSIAHQEWQREQLCVEDMRMRTNINIR